MRTPFAMALGHLIREQREAAGLSQAALGDNLNVTQQTVARWEAGWAYPQLPTLVSLADTLGFSLDELKKAS